VITQAAFLRRVSPTILGFAPDEGLGYESHERVVCFLAGNDSPVV
jgi:hypothetical protein